VCFPWSWLRVCHWFTDDGALCGRGGEVDWAWWKILSDFVSFRYRDNRLVCKVIFAHFVDGHRIIGQVTTSGVNGSFRHWERLDTFDAHDLFVVEWFPFVEQICKHVKCCLDFGCYSMICVVVEVAGRDNMFLVCCNNVRDGDNARLP